MIGAFLIWSVLDAYAKRKGVPVSEVIASLCTCSDPQSFSSSVVEEEDELGLAELVVSSTSASSS